MKHLYTFFMLFAITTTFAQTDLYVTNNTAISIFVDGNGFTAGTNVAPLFVTNGINLAGSDSKIYLRNEAQLIQGNDVGNSGAGQLSAQQDGTVNRYAYNYWCSPVGNNITVPAGNESFRVDLIDESTGLTSSNDVGFTSNLNSSISPLAISRGWLFTYEMADEYSEWNPIAETTPISPGLGFTMKGVGTGAVGSQLYDFRGKPNNGTITNSIADGQWTLIGNPYPSALDAALFLWDTDNMNLDEVDPPVAGTTGAIYYWEQQPGANSHYVEDYVGGYASFTCTDPGLGTPVTSFVFAPYSGYAADGSPLALPVPTNGTKIPSRFIAIGQGFMVEGAAGIPVSLVYVKNNMRTFIKESSGNSYFFRNAADSNSTSGNIDIELFGENGLNIVPADFKRFRINVEFNDTYIRHLLLNFHATATEGFDYGLEAKSPKGLASDASWILNDIPYVIQAHQYDESLKIPLVVNVTNQQPLKFSILDIQNFDASQPIYLHDIDADIYINLRTQNYTINIPAGTYKDRFEITFRNEDALSINEVTIDDFKIFQNNTNAQLTILNPNGLNIKNVRLFDTSGKRVFDSYELNTQVEYHFSTKSLSEGVYVATITMSTNKVISKKVIVKN